MSVMMHKHITETDKYRQNFNKYQQKQSKHLQLVDSWSDISLKQMVTEFVDAGGGCA